MSSEKSTTYTKYIVGLGIGIAGLILLGWFMDRSGDDEEEDDMNSQDEKSFSTIQWNEEEFRKHQALLQGEDQEQAMKSLEIVLRMWPSKNFCPMKDYIQLISRLAQSHQEREDYERAIPPLKKFLSMVRSIVKPALEAPSQENELQFMSYIDAQAQLARCLGRVRSRLPEAQRQGRTDLGLAHRSNVVGRHYTHGPRQHLLSRRSEAEAQNHASCHDGSAL